MGGFPVAMMGSFEGPVVQSSVLWFLPPLLLLVRCCRAPPWTAYAAWALYLAAVLATHLCSASLLLVQSMAESGERGEAKEGLKDQAWHVALLYVINLMLPTTAAIYPYTLTAGHLHRAMAIAESEFVQLAAERELQKRLLHLLVPRPIAERLGHGETRIADYIEHATVVFVYIQGVSELLATHRAADVMGWLNRVFEELDSCVDSWACGPAGAEPEPPQHTQRRKSMGARRAENSVVKVETFNDFYLALSCLPMTRGGGAEGGGGGGGAGGAGGRGGGGGGGEAERAEGEQRGVQGGGAHRQAHADEAVRAALAMGEAACRVTRPDGKSTELRVGVNSGAVCAGVISTTAPRFSIFGDTVNVASRMASTAGVSAEEEGVYVHLADATAALLSKSTVDLLYSRGLALEHKDAMIDIKGKGLMQTWAVRKR